jgi:hypothetical protein
VISVTVTVKMPGLARFKRAVKGDRALSLRITRMWEARLKGFLQTRFAKQSRGGGEWPPLAPSTIERRRKGRGTGSAAILRDTGLLFTALQPGTIAPGGLTKHGQLQLEVGYGGSAKHKSGGVSIADIASFHQTGGGNLPQRGIIVKPDSAVLSSMAKDAEKLLSARAREETNA